MKKLIRIGMLMWIGLGVCVLFALASHRSRRPDIQSLNVGEERLLRFSRHSDLITELRLVNQSMKQLNRELLALKKEIES